MIAPNKLTFGIVCFALLVFGISSRVAEETIVDPVEPLTEEENLDESSTVDLDDLEVEAESDSAVVETALDEESSTTTNDDAPELEADEPEDEITDVFTPSESVSEDNPVAFPRDI